jgi:hypothetical protein
MRERGRKGWESKGGRVREEKVGREKEKVCLYIRREIKSLNPSN